MIHHHECPICGEVWECEYIHCDQMYEKSCEECEGDEAMDMEADLGGLL